jgi:putative oxidoreductase
VKGVDDRIPSIGLLVLRLGTGSLLLYGHGWGKITNFSKRLPAFSDPIGLGPEVSFVLVVFAEVVCSIALMVGLGTRFAAVPIMIFGLIAAFVQHIADPFPKKELALLYAIPALTLLCTGAGRFSLDALVGSIWKRGA